MVHRQARRVDGRRERGAVIVEFALVMPLLVMLLLGIVSAGLAYNRKIDLTHATREGARYGATVSPFQIWQSGSWAENVRNLVVARSGGELSSADVCVALVVNTSATSTSVYSGAGKPASHFTTNADGSTCYAESSPPYSTNDDGLRVGR